MITVKISYHLREKNWPYRTSGLRPIFRSNFVSAKNSNSQIYQIYQITNVLVNAKIIHYAFISSSYNDHSFTKEKTTNKIPLLW